MYLLKIADTLIFLQLQNILKGFRHVNASSVALEKFRFVCVCGGTKNIPISLQMLAFDVVKKENLFLFHKGQMPK